MGLPMELRLSDLHGATAFRAFQRHPKAGKRDLVKWVNAERALCFFCGKDEECVGKWVFSIEICLVMEGLVKMPDLMDGLIDALL